MFLTKIAIITVMVTTLSLEIIQAVKNAVTSDFSEVVRSKYFVDKTLLLEDLLNELKNMKNELKCRFVKVLSQPKYGKTTNLNMIKRFLGINVNESGIIINVNKSDNFLIFTNNNLEIYKNIEFFNNYFGAYPVISVDFKTLCNITSFGDLLHGLRKTMKTTFKDHQYLLKAKGLWNQQFHKNRFQVFFEDRLLENLHEYSIFCSFSILSKILYTHFKKRVIVLIDDFDSFQESPAYKDDTLNSEKKKITTFMGILYSDILLSNKHLFGALLSGSSSLGKLYLKKVSHSEKPYTNIADVSENHNNTLWKYYGLSKNELRFLISRFIHDRNKAKEVEDAILSVNKTNSKSINMHQPCSVWSLMNYFESNIIHT